MKNCGVPVAFIEQISDRSFSAPYCDMILLEVVARRYAVGSFLDRFPHLKPKKGEPPFRFDRPLIEFFLKTTQGVILNRERKRIGVLPDDTREVTRRKPVDDPLIFDPQDLNWKLYHPKIPTGERDSDLNFSVRRSDILPEHITAQTIFETTTKVFMLLEEAWKRLGCRLVDFKIEYGIDTEGNLLIADVIDNDAWRLRTQNWEELSKQRFRDGENMETIGELYQYVAELSRRLKL
ncbi:MAG: hypothetical protein IPL87_03125 [Candidatus Moraniibacteriota bacterium]|nr:MAG: hypothetical protein IPL87_03125 [Candidatus Moranbacteria bacterium]